MTPELKKLLEEELDKLVARNTLLAQNIKYYEMVITDLHDEFSAIAQRVIEVQNILKGKKSKALN